MQDAHWSRSSAVLPGTARHAWGAGSGSIDEVADLSGMASGHVRHRGISGQQQALDVVVEGLRRLEYRGLRLGGRRRARRSAGWPTAQEGRASWPTWRRSSPTTRCPTATTGHRPHPLGHPRRPDRRATPTRTSRRRRRVAVDPQRHHRELRRAAGRARGGRPRPALARPTPRSSRTCSADEFAGAATWPRRCAGSAAGSTGAFTLVAVHARRARAWSSARGATRRWWSASARARTSSASDVAAFIAHTREAIELGQDQVVELRRDGGRRSPTSTGNAVEVRAVPRRLGRLGRREGRLRLLHAQGDRRAAAGGRRHPARPARRRRAAACWTRCGCPTTSCATSTRSSSSRAAPPYHAGLIAKYAIEHWTRIPCEVELASEFRYRDPILDRATRWSSRSASRGETMDTLMAVRHAREQRRQGAGDLQHQRLDDPARVRRRALHARRPGGRGRLDQGVPHPAGRRATWSALYLAQVRGTQVRRRDRRRRRRARRDARRRSTQVLDDDGAGPRAGRDRWPTREAVLFLGRHVGYPVALEGALKLKELAYMHAEGFAAGELKHGPIALIEEGLPVVVVVPPPRPRRAARQDRLATSRRSGPAAPARS